MQPATHLANETLAAKAFSSQGLVFDTVYGSDTMVQYKRSRVRKHLEQFLMPGSSILELNAGTGEDAIYFAERGYIVHATDIAVGMMDQLIRKRDTSKAAGNISYQLCSYLALDSLEQKGPYDCIFSNFAGLNCTGELDKVLHALPSLLKAGGIITMVVLPRFCLWEVLLIFKFKFRTATRRFFARSGASALVEDNPFRCWYYHPDDIINHLQNSFDVISIEGLCTIVPPSYIAGFDKKHPRIFHLLSRIENKLKTKWPWKLIGDYFIITLRKN